MTLIISRALLGKEVMRFEATVRPPDKEEYNLELYLPPGEKEIKWRLRLS